MKPMVAGAELTLVVLRHCNLSCVYCQAPSHAAGVMSVETATRAFDALLFSHAGSPVTINLFGGEPLLVPERLMAIFEALEARARAAGVCLSWRLTTNGTMVSDELLGFLARHGFEVILSIDGPPAVDGRQRPRADGRPREPVDLARWQAALGPVIVTSVLTPEHAHQLPAIIDGHRRAGCQRLAINLDLAGPWGGEARAAFEQAMREVADVWTQAWLSGCPFSLNLLDDRVRARLWGRAIGGCSTHGPAIDPTGAVGPCGLLTASWPEAASDPPGLQPDPACQGCALEPHCLNDCQCARLASSGSTQRIGATLCWREQVLATVAAGALESLLRAGCAPFAHRFMVRPAY